MTRLGEDPLEVEAREEARARYVEDWKGDHPLRWAIIVLVTTVFLCACILFGLAVLIIVLAKLALGFAGWVWSW